MTQVKFVRETMTHQDWEQVDSLLQDGKLMVFPADTVYGLACAANNVQAYKQLMSIKQRDPPQPSAIMFSVRKEAESISGLSSVARQVVRELLP